MTAKKGCNSPSLNLCGHNFIIKFSWHQSEVVGGNRSSVYYWHLKFHLNWRHFYDSIFGSVNLGS